MGAKQSTDVLSFRIILNNKLKPTLKPSLPPINIPSHIYSIPSKENIKRGSIHRNSLIDAIFYAYSNHIDLELSPEDILFAINLIICGVIVSDAEKYKHLVKQCKKFNFNSNATSVENINWLQVLPYMKDQIQQTATTNLVSILEPTFSTTTFIHQIVHCGIMMCTFQNYFKYTVTILCGIPAIRLRGTKQDWQILKQKYSQLKTMFTELQWWYTYFDQVMQLFLDMRNLQTQNQSSAHATQQMKEIWNRIIFNVNFGCGSPSYNGWFQLFSPFDSTFASDSARKFKGDGLVDFSAECEDNSIMRGYATCPIAIDDGIDTQNCTLQSGFVGIEVEKNAVKPVTGFILLEEQKPNTDFF